MSFTTQECDITPYYLIFAGYYPSVVAYERFKTKENFNLLALKVAAVAHERRSLTRVSKYSDLKWKLSIF